ncbi:restriction endonuclease subunit S [Pseudoscardovia radai]|uniref:restriction endonuclease subunit S n=2 Tax=Pseudoscardovia radai TaxID=987066 RepID=UPI0039953E86
MVATQTNRYSTNIPQISCQTGELGTDFHPWEQRQLGEVVSERNEHSASGELLSISMRRGVYPTSCSDRKDNSSEDKSNYKHLAVGDIAYNSMRMWQGACGLSSFDGIISPAYTVAIPSAATDGRFLIDLFKTTEMLNTFQRNSQGLTSDTWNLKYPAFSKIKCSIPSLHEQRRIGEFFSTLDSLIAAAERQEALLRQKKQAYLQLMFPCEGETQPRLRFSGFNGQWQQRQLGEVAEIVGGGTPDSSNADYWDGDIDWYIPSEIGESRIAQASTRKITREGLNHSSARLLPAGSILFTSRASIGLMAFISRPSATNQGFQSLIPNGEVDPDFLYALGPRISRYAKKHAAGSTFIEISGSSLAKAPLRIPKLPEQRLIGQLFSTFDKIISAAEQQIESLQMAKAAYLQRMFV